MLEMLKITFSESFLGAAFRRAKSVLPIILTFKDCALVDGIMFGVKFTENLRMTERIHDKIQQCSKSLFALKTLKSHGMPSTGLRKIYQTTTLASLLYATPTTTTFLFIS